MPLVLMFYFEFDATTYRLAMILSGLKPTKVTFGRKYDMGWDQVLTAGIKTSSPKVQINTGLHAKRILSTEQRDLLHLRNTNTFHKMPTVETINIT